MKKIKLSSEAIKEAAECLRVLAHPMRLNIVQLLLNEERCVTEIAELCEIPHNVASTHLKTMERCRFLSSRRDGKNVWYSVKEKHLYDLFQCIEKKFSRSKNYDD